MYWNISANKKQDLYYGTNDQLMDSDDGKARC